MGLFHQDSLRSFFVFTCFFVREGKSPRVQILGEQNELVTTREISVLFFASVIGSVAEPVKRFGEAQ